MKKLLFGFLFILAVHFSWGQEKNIIKVNPISLAFGNFNASYERAFGEAHSFQIGGNFFFKLLGTDVSGYGVNLAYRYYITHNSKISPEGFYIGPRFAFNYITEDNTDANVSTIGLGGLLGYQWVFDINLTLDLGIGPTYLFVVAEDAGTSASFDGFVPNVIISLGYNF